MQKSGVGFRGDSGPKAPLMKEYCIFKRREITNQWYLE
jgi:hypothetical protein